MDKEARIRQYNDAGKALNEAVEAVRAATDETLPEAEAVFHTAQAEYDRCKSNLDLVDQVDKIETIKPRTLDTAHIDMDGEKVRTRMSPAEQAFGSRESFKGITAGFRAAITIPSARAVSIVGTGPTVFDQNIPAFADYPRGFADTLVQAPTDGAVTFLRRTTKTNNAAQWATGEKAESSYTWTEATAPLTWIAHHTPIAKTEASNWGQLQAIVESEMMVGLRQAKNAAAISGTNAAGIVGVVNTVGTQPYTVSTDADANGNVDNAYDSIRRMATKVFLVSGFRPTHVAMSPQVKEQLDLLKGEDGHYLIVQVGTKVWGLEIVEDMGLTTVDDGATHNGAIVYASIGATWYTKETDNVEIGLVDDQFINNAYTLLAEGRNALAVKYPDAFCYCEDAIPEVADPS
jgi:HK97 family phage major capsid protein